MIPRSLWEAMNTKQTNLEAVKVEIKIIAWRKIPFFSFSIFFWTYYVFTWCMLMGEIGTALINLMGL